VTERAAWPGDALLGLHARFPGRYPVLFESVGGDTPLSRYDVLLCLPGECLVARPDGRLVGGRSSPTGGRFLDALDAWWRDESAGRTATAEVPFGGGWFIYAGYELAGEIEPSLSLALPRHPRAVAWRMRGAVVRDRLTGTISIHAEEGHDTVLRRDVERDMASPAVEQPACGDLLTGDLTEESPATFLNGVQSALDAIGRGDVYQVNLSRGWTAQLADDASPAEIYRRLRAANPAPFAGIAALPGFALLSSSPERLLEIRGRIASTRPIAGTRPRGQTTAADETLKRDLERAHETTVVTLNYANDVSKLEINNEDDLRALVQKNDIAFKDARDQFIREAATGAGPDIAHLAFVWIKDLGTAGACMPLNELIEEQGIGENGFDDFIATDLVLGDDEETIYGVPFASAITSASSWKRNSGATGPNVSSCAICICGMTSVSTVGS